MEWYHYNDTDEKPQQIPTALESFLEFALDAPVADLLGGIEPHGVEALVVLTRLQLDASRDEHVPLTSKEARTIRKAGVRLGDSLSIQYSDLFEELHMAFERESHICMTPKTTQRRMTFRAAAHRTIEITVAGTLHRSELSDQTDVAVLIGLANVIEQQNVSYMYDAVIPVAAWLADELSVESVAEERATIEQAYEDAAFVDYRWIESLQRNAVYAAVLPYAHLKPTTDNIDVDADTAAFISQQTSVRNNKARRYELTSAMTAGPLAALRATWAALVCSTIGGTLSVSSIDGIDRQAALASAEYTEWVAACVEFYEALKETELTAKRANLVSVLPLMISAMGAHDGGYGRGCGLAGLAWLRALVSEEAWVLDGNNVPRIDAERVVDGDWSG